MDSFPVAENFGIEIFPDPSVSGCGLRFADAGLDSTIEFPWWTSVEGDLRAWSISDVPVGSVEDPYVDLEQAWQVLIWRADDWVFLMEGDGEDVFRVWFRVRVQHACHYHGLMNGDTGVHSYFLQELLHVFPTYPFRFKLFGIYLAI